MTISYPRSLPSGMAIQRCVMRQNSNVAVAKSPFTGSEQVHAHQGQWWDADISVTPSEAANARPITAWFASLNGREKTVLFGDPAAATARGSASTTPGTPLVNGASQTGGSLICDGGPNAATGYLLEGDYIQVDTGSASRLHMVLEDVNTDGSGDFTATIWPNIRTSPTENAAITVSSPKGVFRLTENMRSWDESTVIWGFSFGLTEVI